MNSEVERRMRLLEWLAAVAGGVLVLFALLTVSVLVFLAMRTYEAAADVRRSTSESHATLCAFRDDIERRRDASALYLARHPRGFVAGGEVVLSAASIRAGIAAQADTLRAIDEHLVC